MMCYGVHEVTPVHSAIWKNTIFVTLQNGLEKV